jgi:predicted aspartyl protease
MIGGSVNGRHEAVVRLRVRGTGGPELDLDTVVDTGFTASMALPVATATFLGLARQSAGGAVLADGTVRQFDVYAAEVEWNGGWRPVLVSAIGDEALISMLLAGHK